MVKIKRENTHGTGAKQAFRRQRSEPAKIKAETLYELSDTQMTAFGGLLAMVTFLDLVNFKELSENHYCSPSRKPELGCYRMVPGFLMLLFTGFARIGHFGFIRQDPMVCGIMGVSILPAISTFWRYLASLCLNQSGAFLTIGAHMRRRVWAPPAGLITSACVLMSTRRYQPFTGILKVAAKATIRNTVVKRGCDRYFCLSKRPGRVSLRDATTRQYDDR